MVVTLLGEIEFDPIDLTPKHQKQSTWKKVSIIKFNDDTTAYYRWFLKRRFNLDLNKPARVGHVTLVNDRYSELKDWEIVKSKYNGTKILVSLSLDPHCEGEHWWLIVPHDSRVELLKIRQELGLNKPYYGFHMTIGLVHPRCLDHSEYIWRIINKNYI